MNTVNSFQYHSQQFSASQTQKTRNTWVQRRWRQGSTCHHSFPPQTVWKSAKCKCKRSRNDGWYKQFSKCLRTELPRRRQSRMTLHRRRIQAMTSLTLADVSTVAAANARKKLQTTASLRPSWWKWQTRWNVPCLSVWGWSVSRLIEETQVL